MCEELIVTSAELDNYNPDRYDAILLEDGTYRLVPVLWWDESSYAAYQGDFLTE